MARILTPTQMGAEVLINATTANDQTTPAVAALTGGGYVVTWTSLSQDGSGEGVYAQRYDAAGARLGAEVRVNTTTANSQFQAKAAGLADGGYVVTWSSYLQDGSGEGVYAQRYAADGTPAGGEFRVNTTTAQDQMHPSVAALAGGGFVVTWASLQTDSKWDVFAQRYDAGGAAAGGEFRVNTTTANDQYEANVTALSGGGFVVTWDSVGQDGSADGIYAQRYGAGGAALGGEVRVNTTTAGIQDQPAAVALADGGFVVAWASAGQDGSGEGVYARRYDGSGSAAGGEIHVSTATAGDQQHPAVTATADGGFLVSWTSTGQDGSGDGVYAQRFDATGAALGGEFAVNTTTAGNQADSALALLSNGTVVLAWDSAGQDGSGEGVYAQRFSLPATGGAAAAPVAHDFDGDGHADILWRSQAGEVSLWQMNGTQIALAQVIGNPGAYWSIAGEGDFTGDGRTDILWRGQGGEVTLWQMNGAQIVSGAAVAGNIGSYWTVAGTGDVTGDGQADILWRGKGGEVTLWAMNGAQITAAGAVGGTVATSWSIAGTADFNGDGHADILWRGQGGEVAVWQLNGTQVTGGAVLGNPGSYWSIAATADFDGDGKGDILWRGQGGEVSLWEMNGTQLAGAAVLAANPGSYWSIAGAEDVSGDGKADILWRGKGGEVGIWQMDGTHILDAAALSANPGSLWHVIA